MRFCIGIFCQFAVSSLFKQHYSGTNHLVLKVLKAVQLSKEIYDSTESIELTHFEDTLYITHRGTVSKKEWLNNFNLFPISSTLFVGKFHTGFVREFDIILSSEIYTRILDNMHTYDNIVFCGHSRGASMSLLLSQHFARIYPEHNFGVFTFGMPKVADSDFFTYYNDIKNIEHFDYAINDDIVPSIGTVENLSSNRVTLYSQNSKSMKEMFDFYELHSIDRYEDAITYCLSAPSNPF